jgi:hypothetical protein
VVRHLEEKCQLGADTLSLGVAIDEPASGDVSTPKVTLVLEPSRQK